MLSIGKLAGGQAKYYLDQAEVGVDAALAGRHAGMFVAAGVICFIDPKGTFTALADILGFLFLLIGLGWMVRAFLEQSVNPLWWQGPDLRSPDDGHGLLDRRPVALREGIHPPRYAGVWAVMEGITSITRAFAVRRLHQAL